MSETEEHAYLGRIIYMNNAIEKMKKYGLYRHQVTDTLRYGFEVKPLLEGTRQRAYMSKDEYQVEVVFVTTDKYGRELGAIKVITCWMRHVKR